MTCLLCACWLPSYLFTEHEHAWAGNPDLAPTVILLSCPVPLTMGIEYDLKYFLHCFVPRQANGYLRQLGTSCTFAVLERSILSFRMYGTFLLADLNWIKGKCRRMWIFGCLFVQVSNGNVALNTVIKPDMKNDFFSCVWKSSNKYFTCSSLWKKCVLFECKAYFHRAQMHTDLKHIGSNCWTPGLLSAHIHVLGFKIFIPFVSEQPDTWGGWEFLWVMT